MSNVSINLISATQTGAYRIRLVFDDKKVQEVDFQPFLDHSHHPDIRAYLEPARFSGFKLAYGELVWGDYDLCFPVMDLYRNSIEHREMVSEVAQPPYNCHVISSLIRRINALGWQAQVGMADGLAQAYQDFLKNL